MKLSLIGNASFVTGATFNRNPSEIKRKVAEHGPVIVTDRGEPSFVVISAADFEKNYHRPISAAAALDDPEATVDRDFVIERGDLGARAVEF